MSKRKSVVLALCLLGATGCTKTKRQTPLAAMERPQAMIGANVRNMADLNSLVAHIVVVPGENYKAADSADLNTIVQHLNDVEADSCFSDFMTKRGPMLIEKEVNDRKQQVGTGTPKTTEEIVADLTTKPVTTTLDIWYPTWFEYLFRDAKNACAFEDGDGHVHAKASCYFPHNDKERGVTIAHELAHDLGYAHYTAGNREAGNERTVPYSTQYAVHECWDKVPMR
jgi:hypothetical protein